VGDARPVELVAVHDLVTQRPRIDRVGAVLMNPARQVSLELA